MRILFALVLATALCVFAATTASAASPPGSGQPNQTCLSSTAMHEPGNAAGAPGSAFNEPSATSNGGTAGGVYAGSGRNTATPANSNAVSQYDVACFEVSHH